MTEKGILTKLPTIPYDDVKLPSGGLYYNNTKTLKDVKSIKVPYLTGAELDMLLSPSVLQSGEFVDKIVDAKLVDSGIDPGELLAGDVNAVVIFLRSTSVGDIYESTVDCPLCKIENEDSWSLSTLKVKTDIMKPSDDGTLPFTTPQLKHEFIFRYLTRKEDDQIIAIIKDRKAELGQQVEQVMGTSIQLRLEKQIISIGGNTDAIFISEYLKVMPFKDKMKLRQFITKNEPGVELSKSIKCKNTECGFHKSDSISVMLSLNAGFFWTESEL